MRAFFEGKLVVFIRLFTVIWTGQDVNMIEYFKQAVSSRSKGERNSEYLKRKIV